MKQFLTFCISCLWFVAFSQTCGVTGPKLEPKPAEGFVFKGTNGKYGFAIKRLIRHPDKSISYLPDTILPIFDTVVSLANQYMFVKKEGRIAFTNSSYYHYGSKVILEKMEFKYDNIQFFSDPRHNEIENVVGVMDRGLWGYYDVLAGLQGEEIIPPKYFSITPFAPGIITVEYLPGRFGQIDMAGKEYFTRD